MSDNPSVLVAPQTKLYLLTGVPLDNTYKNTLYFASASAQASYFMSKAKYSRTNFTYQREERFVRIDIEADNLWDCNYIMYQNSAYGSKWFYGFITRIEYVSGGRSNVYFEIDVMQTWAFDYTLWPSFVEREHPRTDTVGDNLLPENFELGEYIFDSFDSSGHLGAYSIVVAATFDNEFNDASGGNFSNIYSGLYYNVFTSAQEVNDFIDKATEKNLATGIVSVFMMPSDFIGEQNQPPQSFNITKDKLVSGDIDGYSPKNNKLFTYPYNFMYVTNLNGNSANFPYEYFSGTSCEFGLAGDMSCNPQVILYPKNYKGVAANYNEKMVLDGFPQCAFTSDCFKAWLAQTAAPFAFSAVGTGAQAINAMNLATAAGAASPAIAAAGTAVALPYIAGKLAEGIQHYTLPPHAQSSQGNSALTALRIKDFAFMPCHIRYEFAQIIDWFWTVYGYPCHEIKVPNRNVRPHWNYVKTVDVCITGSIPATDMARIKTIYNNGVTFWMNGNEVGNYLLDNRPSSNRLEVYENGQTTE